MDGKKYNRLNYGRVRGVIWLSKGGGTFPLSPFQYPLSSFIYWTLNSILYTHADCLAVKGILSKDV
jgi:hypothetical protein